MQLLLGNEQVVLRNGITAWTTTMPDEKEEPNQVMFLYEDKIISLAGSASMGILLEFAGNLSLDKNSR